MRRVLATFLTLVSLSFLVVAPTVLFQRDAAATMLLKGVGGAAGGGFGNWTVGQIVPWGTFQFTGTSAQIDSTGYGDLITINVAGATNPYTLSDNKGNTFTDLTLVTAGSGVYTRISYCISCNVGPGHEFYISSGAPVIIAGATATTFSSNGGTVSYSGQQNSATASSGTSINTGSITTSVDDALVISSFFTDNMTNRNMTPKTTQFNNPGSSAPYLPVSTGFYVKPTAGSLNPLWTWNVSGNVATTIAAFYR